ncbi:MAG: transglycosylase SLT domain-containing protein [Campylobacterota bacterium]|nr:transglycosylase SLT domain-containing protein [Campylobacterota bacterium]
MVFFRYFAFLSLPILLFATLTFDTNYQKQVTLLQNFDLPSSFLNDQILNDMVDKNVQKYKNRHFFKAMDDAYLFIPNIKQILSDSNIPPEFLFLAMAESNFHLKAFSSKRASGLWQFMPQTGKIYGLKIDNYVDERRDLIKSTKAASAFLNVLHKEFGKWYLAAIAYNCGAGCLRRAIKKAGSDDINVLLNEKKRYIPKESRYYIRKIVALSLIGNSESHMLKSEYSHLLNRGNSYSLSIVSVPGGEKLSRVASVIKVPLRELKKLNTHLKYDFTPPYSSSYEIYIPYIKLSEFKQKYRAKPLKEIYYVHKVKSGENLLRLGIKYNVRYKTIKDFNHLKTNMLHINQKLIIPSRSNTQVASYSKKSKKRASTNRRSNLKSYFVKSGDTLDKIAIAFNMNTSYLKRLNNLKSNLIHIGDRLIVR